MENVDFPVMLYLWDPEAGTRVIYAQDNGEGFEVLRAYEEVFKQGWRTLGASEGEIPEYQVVDKLSE